MLESFAFSSCKNHGFHSINNLFFNFGSITSIKYSLQIQLSGITEIKFFNIKGMSLRRKSFPSSRCSLERTPNILKFLCTPPHLKSSNGSEELSIDDLS